jgi:aspartate kinase
MIKAVNALHKAFNLAKKQLTILQAVGDEGEIQVHD